MKTLQLPLSADKTVWVYVLCDPETERIRYVGITARPKARLREHCKEDAHTHRGRWIQALIARGLKPTMRFIEATTPDAWEEREQHWITYYREQGESLTNATDGGHGALNPTPEVRDKLAAITREQWQDPAIRARRMDGLLLAHQRPEEKERKRTAALIVGQREEIRQLRSESTNRRWKENAEHREHVTAVFREERAKQKADPTFRDRVAEGNRRTKAEQWKDPDYRAMRSAVSKATIAKVRADPAFLAKNAAAVSATMKTIWSDPEKRAVRVAAIRDAISTPEARERKRAATKAAWADTDKKAARVAAMKDRQQAAWSDPAKAAARRAKLKATWERKKAARE